MSTEVSAAVPLPQAVIVQPQGMRKNGKSHRLLYWIVSDVFLGKQWHEPKSAFRPKAGNGTYEKRQEERKAMAATKAKEKELKVEKEELRQVCKLLRLGVDIKYWFVADQDNSSQG
jgi:rRNA-processing protein CGR1